MTIHWTTEPPKRLSIPSNDRQSDNTKIDTTPARQRMPLLSAEFKTNLAVKYEEAKIYAKNAYAKATTRTPKEPKETDDGSPKKSMTMKEAYFKRMEKGHAEDDDTNPMDRMAAMRLVDATLWDAKETEKLYAAYNKIRAKDGHRHRAKNAKTRYPTVADFYRFFRLETSIFCTQILLMPKKIPIEGLSAKEVEKVCFSFRGVRASRMAPLRLRPRNPSVLHDGPRPQGLFEQRRSQISRGPDLLRAQHGPATHRRHETARLETHTRDEHVGREWEWEHFEGRIRRFSHQHHHLLMPAFSIQRSVRERAFGMTFNWEKIETKRKRVVGTRSIQQVVDDVARLIPEIGGGRSPVMRRSARARPTCANRTRTRS